MNVLTKFREAFEALDPARWAMTVGDGDIVQVDGNTASASYLVISKSPYIAGSETTLEPRTSFEIPLELAFGAHMSQRTLGQEFAIELIDTSAPLADVPNLAIASITQTTTTLTVDTVSPHGLTVGKSIGICDCSNQLLNFPALVVASIPSPSQFTVTAGPGGPIASQTIANPAGAKGFVFFRERLGRASNGVSQIFENAVATNASLYVRSESGDALTSGTIAGNHSTTAGSTASIQLTGNTAYSYSFTPTTEYRCNLQSDRVQWLDGGSDSLAQTASRSVRTQVCPDPSEQYKFRIRATNSKSLTVLGAKVLSAVKTGTTIGTFTTSTPHGLITGDQITYYGNTNTAAAAFPNLIVATAVTVLTPTTFTAAIGTASTVTGYGGVISKVQGGNLSSALGANAVTGIAAQLSTLSDGTRQLVLTGASVWAGVVVGDYVEASGVSNAVDGALLGVDGPWKVANIATTLLTLVPATAGFAATLPANFGLTTSGGAIVRRTCLRLSYVRVYDYARDRVEMLARPSGDLSSAAPVVVQGGALAIAGTATVGGAAVDAAIGLPVTAGLRASNANIAAMSAPGDNVGWMGTMIGAGIVKPYALPEAGWNASVSLTTTVAEALQTAGGAGLKRHMTALQAINTGAGPTDLIILDGATERWRITLPVNMPVSFEFPTELVTTAATALNANLSTAVNSVRINAQGYTAP